MAALTSSTSRASARRYGTRTLLDGVSLGVDEGDADRRRRPQRRRQVHAARLLTGRERARRRPGHAASAASRSATLAQHDDLAPAATVRDVVVGDRRRARVGRRRRASATCSPACSAARAACDVGLDALGRPLSGGERRRVALAALLVGRARPAGARRADQPPRRRGHRLARRTIWRAPARGAAWSVTHDRWFLDAVCDADLGGRRRRRCSATRAATRPTCSPGPSGTRHAPAQPRRRRQNLLRKELAWLRRGPPARTSQAEVPHRRRQRADRRRAAAPGQRRAAAVRHAPGWASTVLRPRGRRPSRSAAAGCCSTT